MQSKILSRRTFLTIIIAVSIFSIGISCFIFKRSNLPIDRQIPNVSIVSATNTVTVQPTLAVSKPARLRIPQINVDSPVEFVGLTAAGVMDVPKKPDEVAWLELGRRPGESGSAVIAGHYGTWKNGKGSVFDNLHKLRKGDELFIEDDKGVIISFVMVDSRNYDPEADASDVFSSNDGKSHLNLITCEGVWDEDSQSYPSRLVVFADKK
jgi:LPXTG-site transpeptidase (sortase) family protein